MYRTSVLLICVVLTLLGTERATLSADAGSLDVLSEGQALDDHRYEPLKDLNGYFPLQVPETAEAWKHRASELRRRVLVANGLWPMPEKTPLNAVIHSRVERDGFTVEKVYFESHPGFYVTGLLFRPSGKEGPFPGVLCPHGHGGRLQDTGDRIRTQISRGEERFEESGRFPKLARCAQLARMGCVALIPDMIGYADCTQLSYELVHRYAERRPEMEGNENWGFFSTQAELRCQSLMGLQTWNCIRGLDFLCELPDVDTSRLGVTGSSGGGTQTILLCAIDPRPVVAFPQGMVSTAMQGGCTCENCNLLRVGTGNVELAALFAPKPQAMTAANDWTRDMMTLGYPELKELYTLLGKPKDVECTPYVHFPHNYNYVTRGRMYSWFNKHLRLGLPEPIVEEDYRLLTPEEYTVWDKEHPEPASRGDAFEQGLVGYLTQQSDQQFEALQPHDESSATTYQEVVGGAVATILGRTIESVGPIDRTKVDKIDRESYWLFTDLLTATDHGEQVPVVSLLPKTTKWNGRVVIWLTGTGKAGLFSDSAEPLPKVQSLLEEGCAIIAADLLGQGEATSDEVTSEQNRAVPNPRQYAGYTYTYNTPLFAQRVHDVLTLLQWVQTGEYDVQATHLVGTGSIGPVVAAAGAVSGSSVSTVSAEINGFRFSQLTDYRDVNFLPGIVKYGDVPALLALNASRPLQVFDNHSAPKLVRSAFSVDDSEWLSWTDESNVSQSVVTWLLEQ